MRNSEEEILHQLLKTKVQKSTEIEHHLFEKCNLSCSFCGQDHDSEVGMDSIQDKAHQTVDWMRDSGMKDHTVNVMGGEIFNDLIEESVFEDYYYFYRTITDYAVANDMKVRINFVTNLIFIENIKHVKRLMKRCGDNAWISTSYDFAGRGLNLNRMLTFKHNLELFKPYIGVVGFVLARPSVRKLLLNQDKFFKDTLYANFPLYFDWYVPENSADKMMPSEQEMLDALRFVADHYPKIEPVKSLLENEQNQMTCFSLNKTTILPDGKEVKCRYMEYKPEQFLTPIDYSTNSGIINAHLERNECFSCEWFNRCQFRCFVQSDWAGLERLPTCMFKTFFNEKVGK